MMGSEQGILSMVLHAGWVVQFVLLVLLFFSVVSWAIIITKYFSVKKALKASVSFVDYFFQVRNLSEAFDRAAMPDSGPVAQVYRAGYRELRKAPASGDAGDAVLSRAVMLENIKRALRRETDRQIDELSKLIPFLATAGNITPFIGLFGTVWGIMESFHSIGQKGAANLAVVAPGISEALVATAAGLAVAIPAVIAYNYFVSQVRAVEAEMETFSSDFLNIVERESVRMEG